MQKKSKNIFLLVNHAWTVRNFLLSDFYNELTKSFNVYLCSSLESEDLKDMNIKAHKIYKCISFKKNWLHMRFAVRRENYHYAIAGSETYDLKLKHRLLSNSYLRNFFIKLELKFIKFVFGSSILNILDKIDKYFMLRLKEAEYYQTIFDDIKPDIVFSTFSVIKNESLPLYVAKNMGVKTVVNITSWDNISSKGRLAYDLDCYLAWSKNMKHEILDFHETLLEKNVKIVGTPQFDFHIKNKLKIPRRDFCNQYGLNPNKKIILFSGVTPSLMPYEHLLVEEIFRNISNGNIKDNPQLIVRPHPVDNLGRYKTFEQDNPEICFIKPSDKSINGMRNMIGSTNDLKLHINSVVHCDLNLNVFSTMTLDAAIFNKPIINIGFEVKPKNAPKCFGIEIYNCTHYQPLLKTNGVKIAFSIEELINHSNSYLLNPNVDEKNRKKIVDVICGKVDGNAGIRISQLLKELAS